MLLLLTKNQDLTCIYESSIVTDTNVWKAHRRNRELFSATKHLHTFPGMGAYTYLIKRFSCHSANLRLLKAGHFIRQFSRFVASF